MSFPARVDAQVLAGGRLGQMPPGEVEPAGKGLVSIGELPMAARPLQALKASVRVDRVVLVSPVPAGELDPAFFGAADAVAQTGASILESFANGLRQARFPEQPVLSVAGDLAFLTPEAVTDFVDRCRRRPDVDVWCGCLRREHSERAYPGLQHTWARLAEGTFCGTGLFLIRPSVLERVQTTVLSATRQRKNPLALARLLGLGPVLAFVLGRLTLRQGEQALKRVLGGVACAGIETPFAESAFNVDDLPTLLEARRLASLQRKPLGGMISK
ncbi:hypothetical protein DYH09_18755 [bacterium CPR1]|nr:hypothetical protein [bacterium CPR1]